VLVKALMLQKEELITGTPDESLKIALNKINERNFLSIPVVDGKKFAGVISREKIFDEYFEIGGNREDYLDNTKIKKIIRTDIPSVRPQDEIEKAAQALINYGVPFVAVINEADEFEGIITHFTIFKEFLSILGIDRGKRLSVIAYDIPGQIAKLSEIISRNGGDILSFVVLDPKIKTEVKEIVVRIKANNFAEIVEAVSRAGFRVQ
jgi:acetoin utilization protein AcuB